MNNTPTIEDTLYSIIGTVLDINPALINPNTHLFNDFDADSIEMIDILNHIKNTFNVVIDKSRIDEMLLVQRMIEHLQVALRLPLAKEML